MAGHNRPAGPLLCLLAGIFFRDEPMNDHLRRERIRFLHRVEHPDCAECSRKGRRVAATAARFVASPRVAAGQAYRVEGLVSVCRAHDRGDDR